MNSLFLLLRYQWEIQKQTSIKKINLVIHLKLPN